MLDPTKIKELITPYAANLFECPNPLANWVVSRYNTIVIKRA